MLKLSFNLILFVVMSPSLVKSTSFDEKSFHVKFLSSTTVKQQENVTYDEIIQFEADMGVNSLPNDYFEMQLSNINNDKIKGAICPLSELKRKYKVKIVRDVVSEPLMTDFDYCDAVKLKIFEELFRNHDKIAYQEIENNETKVQLPLGFCPVTKLNFKTSVEGHLRTSTIAIDLKDCTLLSNYNNDLTVLDGSFTKLHWVFDNNAIKQIETLTHSELNAQRSNGENILQKLKIQIDSV